MTFSSDFTDLNTSSGIIKGQLTLLGQTKPLALNFKINKIAKYPFRIGLTKPIVMEYPVMQNLEDQISA